MPLTRKASGLAVLAAVLISCGSPRTETSAAPCAAPPAGSAEKLVVIKVVGGAPTVSEDPVRISEGKKERVHWCYAGGDVLIVFKKEHPFRQKPTHNLGNVRSTESAAGKLGRFPYMVIIPVPGKDPLILDPDVEVVP